MTHKCGFCQRSFQRETSLAVHMCEPKRRHSERSERGVELALQAFLKFYETLQGTSQLKTWDDFVASSYYRAFVKWGRYCVNTRVIQPEQFLVWLLRTNQKIDRWASDTVYTQYLVQYLPQESVQDALRRAESWSLAWSDQTGSPARDCLRYGNHHAICHAVTAGRLSAWVLYNCDSGQAFLANLAATDMQIIWPYIDSDVWGRRLSSYPADAAWAEAQLSTWGW